MGRRNPLTDWAQFFLGERYPSRNQAHQIWWRSLKVFRGSCGSNFSISHWLCWSSLQHSHTTVWACDVLPLCGWRRVCTQWPGKMTRKGRILKVTQQGAARIWHGSVQTNWPSNGPGTKSDIYDLPCQVMDSRSTPSRSGFKYQPQTTCLQIISIAKQYNVVDKSSLKSCSHTLD